jgi:formyltetrahydrofolate-dependent phosphoribosylglycinamide formyltransferase
MPTPPINIAVLVSGSGTTLQNLIDQVAQKRLDARIRLVIGSKAGIKGIERAAGAGIEAFCIQRKDCTSLAHFSQRVFAMCDEAKVDLVCLGGWLSLLEIPDKYVGRAMNIHPALLPSFGGKGMYGRFVHQAVIDHGCKVSGCTVHFVDNTYDSGPIILQRTCPVIEGDDASTLAARVFEEERIAYPEAIRLFSRGKLRIEGRRVHVA